MSNLQTINDEIYNGRETGDDIEIIQLVGLKLGEEEYAIDVLKIQEIIRTVEITTVPRTDSFVLGVMNLRGKVIPVIDLRVRFSLDKMDFDKETRIIVVRFDNENIGFVVDEVTEVIRINKSMVEPTPPLVGSVGQEYILGICKYDDRLIILLDIDSVMADGKSVDSELRRRFLGTGGDVEDVIDYDKIAENVEASTANAIAPAEELPAIEFKEEPAEEEAIEDEPIMAEEEPASDMLDDIDAQIAAELAKREQETEDLNRKKKIDETDDEPEFDDIDAQIAAELAKREKETEELLAAQKNDDSQSEALDNDIDPELAAELGLSDDMEDVLNDALNQTNAYESEIDHVDQNELDSLIAAELAKREKETEELLEKKRAEKKNKKISNDIDFDNYEVEITPPEEEISTDSAENSVEELLAESDSLISEDIEEESSEFDTADEEEWAKQMLSELGEDSVVEESAMDEAVIDEPVDDAVMEAANIESVEEESSEFDTADEEEWAKQMLNEMDEDPVAEESIEEEPQPAFSHMEAEEEQGFSDQEADSIEDLKEITKKIIEGEAVDLGIDFKGELGELLRLVSQTKVRIDDIDPTVVGSKEQMPNVVKTLEMVNETTEEATINLMSETDRMSVFYSEFIDELNDLEDIVYKKDAGLLERKLEKIEESIQEADQMGFGILQALEFQDITEQKLRKTIESVEDIGSRLGALLGFIDRDSIQRSSESSTSQDDIDKLLMDFGLA